MKNLFSLTVALFVFTSVMAQVGTYDYRIYLAGNYRVNGSSFTLPCNNSTETIDHVEIPMVSSGPFTGYEDGDIIAVLELPNNWTASLNGTILTLNIGQGSGGTLKLRFRNRRTDERNEITLYISQHPIITFTSTPSLCGQYQYGDFSISSDRPYNNIVWQAYGGLQVNGGQSVTTVVQTATVNTRAWGGQLYVRASNNCGYSPYLIANVGTPYITGVTVNGSPSQSINYVNGSATLNVYTAGTANSFNWVIDGGNGYLSSYGASASATPNNFMRVRVGTINGCGNGETYTFHLQKQGTYGYKTPYPNPVSEILTVELEDESLINLLNGLTLIDDKGKTLSELNLAKFKNKNNTEKKAQLDVKGIAKGFYFLHVTIGEVTTKSTIIIE